METLYDSFSRSSDSSKTATVLTTSQENDSNNSNNQSPVQFSLNSNKPMMKRCKHGRIIVKDRSKKKTIQPEVSDINLPEVKGLDLDYNSRDMTQSINLTEATTTQSIYNPPLSKLNLSTSSLSTNCEFSTADQTNINNNDSDHVSHEPSANPTSDKSTSNEGPARSPSKQDSPSACPKPQKKMNDASYCHRRKSSSRVKKSGVSSGGGRQSRSPARDNSRSPSTHKTKLHKTCYRRGSTPPKTVSPNHRRHHCSRPRSPRWRRSRSRSRSRSRTRESRIRYSSRKEESSNNIQRRSNRREPAKTEIPDTYDTSRDESKSRVDSQQRSTNLNRPASKVLNPDTGSSKSLSIPSETNERKSNLSPSEISKARNNQQSLPRSQSSNLAPNSKSKSSPHETISAHSSMIFSPEDDDSKSSDIYDPEEPVLSIDSDIEPISSTRTASRSNRFTTDASNNEDEMPSSATQLNQQEKYLQKLNRQERVVEEVKIALKPHYQRKSINKEQYKDVLRRAVPKVCHSKNGEINPIKIQALVDAYVRKMKRRK